MRVVTHCICGKHVLEVSVAQRNRWNSERIFTELPPSPLPPPPHPHYHHHHPTTHPPPSSSSLGEMVFPILFTLGTILRPVEVAPEASTPLPHRTPLTIICPRICLHFNETIVINFSLFWFLTTRTKEDISHVEMKRCMLKHQKTLLELSNRKVCSFKWATWTWCGTSTDVVRKYA